MKPLFLCYAKCGTCVKASKWLKSKNIEVDVRDITIENPTFEELVGWFRMSGLTINKMFNTSGVKYRELGVKDKIKSLSEMELLELLSTDGKLVKRPLLITEGKVLVGFNEADYEAIFND